MQANPLRLIRKCAELHSRKEVRKLSYQLRGIYTLLNHDKKTGKYDVVYVGMARRGIRGRLRSHANSAKKRGLWTHFSVFEVWPNITDGEIEELEGLFRHIFRQDSRAIRLGKQRTFKKLEKLRVHDIAKWA